VDALRARGFTVRSGLFGNFTAPVEAEIELRESVAVCLIATKATSLEVALRRASPRVLEHSLIVPFLNGIEHVAAIRRFYPSSAVVPATIRVEAYSATPGEIDHLSPFASLEVASNPTTRGRLPILLEHLAHAGLEVQTRDDETAMLWGKLIFLAPMALLTTQTQSSIGVIREKSRGDLIAMITEAVKVARAEGVPADVGSVLAFMDRAPASFQSSMQRDALAGRPVEIEAIGGVIERTAARHGIEVPVTTRVGEEIRARFSAAAAEADSL
jgi:2-dehydropantoate 2-reductase